jgi:hypothetical protein
LKTETKVSKPERREKAKKNISKSTKPEIQVVEEGPAFGLKLRKAETVKSKWEETKVEDIGLKHHEFEPIPKVDLDKKVTFVRPGKVLSISILGEEPKRKRKNYCETKNQNLIN